MVNVTILHVIFLFSDTQIQQIMPLLYDSGLVDYFRSLSLSPEITLGTEINMFVGLNVERYVETRIFARYFIVR